MKSAKERVVMEKSMIIIIWCLLFSLDLVKGEQMLGCSPGLNTSGVTLPQGDIALLYGQPLDIYCILNPEHEYVKYQGYNSSHLIFTRGKDTVDPDTVTVMNSTAIHLHVPKPAISESMYYCKILHRDGEAAVCLNDVIVGTEPQEVDNFECYSLNWNNLTCTWKPPHNYLKTYFYLSFRLPRRNSRMLSFQCPNITMETETGEYFCFWDLSTSPPYRQAYSTYYFNLTSLNKYGSRTQEFVFNHYAYMKPSTPLNLTVTNKTPHSCQLHWSLPEPIQNFPPGVIHRIVYHTDLEDIWYTVNSSGLALNSDSGYSYNLTDLPYAYRHYNVRVAIRSEKAILEKFWSQYASVTFRTLGKPPERSPRVDIGSFELSTNLIHRNVTIYWEQLGVYEENGYNFTYKVEVLIDGVKVNYLSAQSERGYAFFKGLPLKALKFLISASNVEGDSPSKSSLIVPPRDDILAEPSYFTKIDLGNRTYELDWKAPKVNSSLLTSYTIYWCDNARDRPHQCEGRLQWERIPANITTKNCSVPDDKIYQFAISANGYETSSGMVWASCTVIPNKAVGKIKEIWVHKLGATFVEIKWKLECADNVGVIKGYRISCCPIFEPRNTTCKEAETTVLVMHNDNIGILKDLKPYTTYGVQVAIIAKHEVGPQSDPILVTTYEAAPDPPQNVSISGLSSKKMRVKWQPPVNRNGVILFYRVCYRTNDDSPWSEVKAEKDVNETELTNLLSYTNYTVCVIACGKICSNTSEELLVRTAIGVPGIVEGLVVTNNPSDQIQMVKWQRPIFAGGTLDLYSVRRTTLRQGGNDTVDFNTTDTSLKIEDRGCQEEDILGYLYSVKAINFDSDINHGATAFTHMESVNISKRMLDDDIMLEYSSSWSSDATITCSLGYGQNDKAYWVIGVVTILLIIILALSLKKAWIVIDKMRTIKPIMPDGLFPESEKDSKYPLGNWNPPPKHTKDPNTQYPSVKADEVSLLGNSPQLVATSPGDLPNAVPTSGISSHRTNSPTWPSLAPYSAVGTWPTDESDAEVPPPPADSPYITYTTEAPSAPVAGGYVQASMLPSIRKDSPTTMLPSNYVLSAPVPSTNVVASSEMNDLPSSYVRTAPEPATAPAPRVAVVSPYVTGFTSPHPQDAKKEPKSGYVTHNHAMFNKNPKTELPVLEEPVIPKRVSAPPLLNPKFNNDTNNKRISLSNNYSAVGLNNPNLTSSEYCRFGWNAPENMGMNHQHLAEPREDSPQPINIANLSKEEYELPLEDFLSDEDTTASTSKPTTASHYLPLSLHTLKS